MRPLRTPAPAALGWPALPWAVFVRDGARCQYCRASGAEDFGTWRGLELDLVSAPPPGAPLRERDLVVCCRRCRALLREWTPEDQAADERLLRAVARPRAPSLARQRLAFEAMVRAIRERRRRAAG